MSIHMHILFYKYLAELFDSFFLVFDIHSLYSPKGATTRGLYHCFYCDRNIGIAVLLPPPPPPALSR